MNFLKRMLEAIRRPIKKWINKRVKSGGKGVNRENLKKNGKQPTHIRGEPNEPAPTDEPPQDEELSAAPLPESPPQSGGDADGTDGNASETAAGNPDPSSEGSEQSAPEGGESDKPESLAKPPADEGTTEAPSPEPPEQPQEGEKDTDGSASESDAGNIDALTDADNKSEPRAGARKPRKIGGRRTDPDQPVNQGERGVASFTPSPELICRERQGEWKWEIVLSVPEECDIKEVLHNGKSLFSDNCEYLLPSFSGKVNANRTDGKQYEIPLFNDKFPLIFKFSKNWQGQGRRIRGGTRGHFILIAPREWTRTGDVPVKRQECVDNGFLAHFFHVDQNDEEIGGFEECGVTLTKSWFELSGESLFDDSDEGELFVGDPPELKPRQGIVWVRVGEEKKGDWKGESFKRGVKSLEDVLNGRQGRFYVRVYG